MRRIKGKNTAPELAVRKVLTEAGVRYRLHRKNLPGKPDIAIGRIRTAIFVHGCFWHRHDQCPRSFVPQTRKQFWQAKFRANVKRDAEHSLALEKLSWTAETVWECEAKDLHVLRERLRGLIQEYGDYKDAH